MIIQFPHPKQNPAPVKPPKTNLTGLYLLLAFSVLYLTCVWLTQHYASHQAAIKKPLATTSHAH
jgi:hypothetical protein